VLLFVAPASRAELVVVANDNKVVLVNGVQTVVKNPPPDTLAVIDLAGDAPRLVAEIEGVPSSVVGPPTAVAVTPDEHLALITSGNKIDPANPSRQVADNRLTVVDLTTSPPRVIATLETGRQPSGVSINREGTLALVGNRLDGTVSVFGIDGRTVTSLDTIKLGDAAAGVRHAIFTPDGKRALVTREGDHMITVLNVDGRNVTLAGRNIRSGLKPYAAATSRNGDVAVVGNVGFLNGDADTIGVIDLRLDPPRAVASIEVGQTPESVGLSPDGTLCAVVLLNGSTKPRGTPFHSPQGRLRLYRVAGTNLTLLDEAPLGAWPQAVVFSADNRILLATSMAEQVVHVFSWDGSRLRDTSRPIRMKGGPAAMGAAPR
jgi:DNA-binding beta-propeller fold protein YncE